MTHGMDDHQFRYGHGGIYRGAPEQQIRVGTGTQKEYMQMREQARKHIVERIAVWNTEYRFTFQRIAIRNQKTRWGSCSAQGNLNFNYRLLLLPHHLTDYIVVHELCHLQELNHSRAFWALVARAIPDHTHRRKELRGYTY